MRARSTNLFVGKRVSRRECGLSHPLASGYESSAFSADRERPSWVKSMVDGLGSKLMNNKLGTRACARAHTHTHTRTHTQSGRKRCA